MSDKAKWLRSEKLIEGFEYWTWVDGTQMLELHYDRGTFKAYLKELFSSNREFIGEFTGDLSAVQKAAWDKTYPMVQERNLKSWIYQFEDDLADLADRFPDFIISWDIQYKKK